MIARIYQFLLIFMFLFFFSACQEKQKNQELNENQEQAQNTQENTEDTPLSALEPEQEDQEDEGNEFIEVQFHGKEAWFLDQTPGRLAHHIYGDLYFRKDDQFPSDALMTRLVRDLDANRKVLCIGLRKALPGEEYHNQVLLLEGDTLDIYSLYTTGEREDWVFQDLEKEREIELPISDWDPYRFPENRVFGLF